MGIFLSNAGLDSISAALSTKNQLKTFQILWFLQILSFRSCQTWNSSLFAEIREFGIFSWFFVLRAALMESRPALKRKIPVLFENNEKKFQILFFRNEILKNVDFWSMSDIEKKSDTLPARLASSELRSESPDQRCAAKLLSFENQNKNLVFIKLFLFKSQHFVKFLIRIRNLMEDSSWSRADGSHYWWKMYMFNKTNKSRCVPKMRSNGGCQRCERARCLEPLHLFLCLVTLTEEEWGS